MIRTLTSILALTAPALAQKPDVDKGPAPAPIPEETIAS